MTEFETEITAERMKHAVNILRRVDDEVVVQVSNREILSRVVNPADHFMVEVSMGTDAYDYIHADEPHRIGIELGKFGAFLRRAAAKDSIRITAKDTMVWYVSHGIHQRAMGLLDPTMLRAVPKMDEVAMYDTTALSLSGKEFKEIVTNAADVGDRCIMSAGSDGMTFVVKSKELQDEYTATLAAEKMDTTNKEKAICKYDVAYLTDVAKDVHAKDELTLEFATGQPCAVRYGRDGVNINFLIAPIIEDK